MLFYVGLALATACGSHGSTGRGGPGPASGTPGPAPTPATLAGFLGNGLSFWDHGSFGLDRAELLDDPGAPGGKVLRTSYPKGSASPTAGRDDNAPEGGTQAYLLLAEPKDTLTLRYQVRFQPGFEFVKGGKLPGLFGGTAGSGGEHREDGFSTRFMWRTGGAGEVYAYLPEQQGYGDSLGRGSWTFSTGDWNQIAQHVELNTPGQANGSVTVWLNDSEVFHQSGLIYRSSADLHIDGVFFSTFFGGEDTTWASPADQYADFAGFTLN
ncbi:MAG TPA: hypothetical protein VGP05_08110 [Pseudonocardia sp.]|nr:hypothetical protein [Pseudonocardia sp.]